jgi:kinetochore protein Fta7
VEQFPFPTLKPRVRRVPRQIVSTKWDVLPQAAQGQVRELLNAIERPVLMSYRNERRREEAQSILGSVLRKLSTKIPRMPFPSKTKDIHFNYEMLLDANVRTVPGHLSSCC